MAHILEKIENIEWYKIIPSKVGILMGGEARSRCMKFQTEAKEMIQKMIIMHFQS
jgi:hypothetical protein